LERENSEETRTFRKLNEKMFPLLYLWEEYKKEEEQWALSLYLSI